MINKIQIFLKRVLKLDQGKLNFGINKTNQLKLKKIVFK